MNDILFDDAVLHGKTVITAEDIYNILPTEVQVDVEQISIMINNGLPIWLIFVHNDLFGYEYIPFSGVLKFNGRAKCTMYGRIYVYRKGRYLRRERTHSEYRETKVYSIFYCFRHSMRLLKEQKEYWLREDDYHGWGSCVETKWFSTWE